MNDDRRVARLEEEITITRAQAERDAIEHQHTTKALEDKFLVLLNDYNALKAAEQQLQARNNDLQKETKTLRSSVQDLQSKPNEIQSLHNEKRALDNCLEARDAKIADLEERLQKSQASITALRTENMEMDGTVLELKASKHQAEEETAEAKQQNSNLKRSIQWLEEQARDLGHTIDTVQQRGSKQANELLAKLQAAEEARSGLEKLEVSLRAQLETSKETSKAQIDELVADNEKLVKDNSELEKQLSSAQKLIALYKKNSEQRTTEVLDLQNVVRDLRSHIEEMTGAHKTAISQLEEAVNEAEKRLEEEKARAKLVLSAATSGQFLTGPEGAPETSTAEVPGSQADPPLAANMSKTELFAKLTEATAEWRRLSLQNQQNEIILDGVVAEMEKRGAAMREQEADYVRVQQSYSAMVASLEVARNERRFAESKVLDLEFEIRSREKTIRILQQQVKDNGRQIVVLLNEQQRLTGGQMAGSSRPQTPQPRAFGSPAGAHDSPYGSASQAIVPVSNGSGRLAANDALSKHVTFANIQELQEKNERQLLLIRDMSEQLEEASSQLKKEMEAEKQAMRQKMEGELEHVKKQRQEQTAIVTQIAGQRDLYRKLLQDVANKPQDAAASAADLQLLEGFRNPTQSSSIKAQDAEKYEKLYIETKRELNQKLDDSAENLRIMRNDYSRAKDEATQARSEVARAKAEVAFERQNVERLNGFLEEHRIQLKIEADFSAKNQETIAALQERWSAENGKVQSVQFQLKAAENKVSSLEHESAALERQVERLKADLHQETTARISLEAELRALRKEHLDLEAEQVQQIHDLKVRLAAAESAKSTADNELQNAEKLARGLTEMHSTSKADLEARVRAAEDLARASKSAEAQAVRSLNVQKEQVISLQKSLQEAQLHAPTQGAQNGPQSSKVAPSDEGTEQRQARAIQLLQGELKSALERAEQASQDAAQYRAVAEGSDLALQALQAQASSDKKTFEQQAANSAAEVERLTRELDASITACSEIEEKLKSSNIASTQSAVRASNETSKLQEHLKELDRLILAKTEDLAEKERDVNFWRQKYNTAESRSHAEVVGHAETVKLLQAAESSRQVLNDSVAAHLKAEKEARDKQAEAELRLSQIEAQLKEKVDQTERKLAEIEKQNKQLHDSLQEKLRSGDTGGEAEKELAGVISHLRHRAEVLEVEKQLASSKAEQYRSEIGVLRKTLDSLKTQLASEATRQQQAQNEEALFEERRKHQADLQMIKESNVSLRSQNASIQSQNASLKGEVQLLQSQLKPQELTILQLRADVEAAEEEVASKAIEAANWERRANHLRQKYGTVDLEEHKKVQAKLAELSENTVPRIDLQKAQARVRELEAKASAQVGKEYHDNFTKQLNTQIATLKKNLQQEQSRNAIHLSEITGLKEKITELEGDKKALDSRFFKATRMVNLFNPKKLHHTEFKAEREAERKESEAARELTAALQEFITGELSPAAVTEQLRANRESLASLQSQLRGSTQASQEMASLQHALQNSRKYAGGLQEELQSTKLALSQAESKLAAAEALVSELQHRVRGLETNLNSIQSQKTAAPRAGHQASPLPAPELVSGPSSSGPIPTNEAMDSSAPSVQLDVMQTEAPQPEASPEELASEVQPTNQPPQLTHPAASLPEGALENLPPPEVIEPLLQSEPLARQLAEADSSAVRPSDAAAFIPLEPVESQEPTDLDIASNPKADASQAGPESSKAKPVLIEPTTSPLEQSDPTHVTQPTEPDPMTEPEPIINPEGAAPAEAPKEPEDSAPAPEQGGQAPASSAPTLAEQEQAALPAALTQPAQANQPAESLPTPSPTITPQLNPNAPPFPGGDIMELLRQQALAQAQQPKSNQSTPPPLAPISHTPPPISQPAPSQQHLEGPGTARRLAGEAAVKRQQETSQSSEPPAKRARSQATAAASIGPAIAASTTPVTSSSLIERTVTDASQAEDVADDAQSSGSEEVKELQDDPMERETRNQEQQEPVELTDSDGAETEDEAGDEIGQDMPSLPSSPHRPAAAEDPTQPPSSPKASAEYPTHPPAATVASHDLAQEKEDEPKEEKAAEQGGPRKRRVQPIVWSGASGREKEDQKSKKEGSPPPGGRGGSLIRQVRRGRGRGRST